MSWYKLRCLLQKQQTLEEHTLPADIQARVLTKQLVWSVRAQHVSVPLSYYHIKFSLVSVKLTYHHDCVFKGHLAVAAICRSTVDQL